MSKIPGGKAHDKTEPLLTDGSGVVAEVGDQLQPVAFFKDHQIPPPDEPKFDAQGLSIVSEADMKALKAAGFDVVVGRGGLSGHLNDS